MEESIESIPRRNKTSSNKNQTRDKYTFPHPQGTNASDFGLDWSIGTGPCTFLA